MCNIFIMRVYRKLLFWGAFFLVFICVAGIPLAKGMMGGYTPGLIHVRPWMAQYNYIMSAAHLVAMALMTIGAKGCPVHAGESSRWRVRGAVIGLSVTCAAIAGMFAFPLVFGWGPWPYDSPPVSIIRVLVLLPATLRPAAVALVVLALSPPQAQGSRWFALRNRGIYLFLAIDLVLAGYKWLTTPKAVIALVHLYQPRPVLMVPWIAAMVLFLVAAKQDLFRREA